MSPLKLVAVLLIASAGLADAQGGFEKLLKMKQDLLNMLGVDKFIEAETSAVPKLEGYTEVVSALLMKAEAQRNEIDKMVAEATMQRKKEQAEFDSMVEPSAAVEEANKQAQEKYDMVMNTMQQQREEIRNAMYFLAGGDGLLDEVGEAADHLMEVALVKMQNLTGVERDQAKLMEVKSKADMQLAMMEKKMKELGEALQAYNATDATPEEQTAYFTNEIKLTNMEDEMNFMKSFMTLKIAKVKKESLFPTMAFQFAGPLTLEPKPAHIKQWYKDGNCCKADCKLMMMVRGPGEYELMQAPNVTGNKVKHGA